MSSLKKRTKEKPRRNDILNLPDCPRGIAVAAFHLTTVHDCLYALLGRFRIVDSPACPLCCSGAAMNTNHLPVCSALTKNCIYSRYWEPETL
ncbi:hypothetical protein NPIL_647631 [Nephila pilipes]|uniref:Uncharacterized protein n=1 Tax=Nephila pilipes TaxID=299642 RepID=A0A8X6UKI2_NEPPI|nr:hypothetical protein NPIL_647631 [Nephila pilipes]